jgi:hypothetical protein
MRHLSVHHRQGAEYVAVVEEVPWWALAVSTVADQFCHLSAHRFCFLLGGGLFLADDRARELYRIPISAEIAQDLGARLSEFEGDEDEDGDVA